MTVRFPHITGFIEEVDGGYTVTVFLRTAPGLDSVRLLADQSADTIDEARGIISNLARDQSILEEDVKVDIKLFDLGPPGGPIN
jgi:hypothetical protein